MAPASLQPSRERRTCPLSPGPSRPAPRFNSSSFSAVPCTPSPESGCRGIGFQTPTSTSPRASCRGRCCLWSVSLLGAAAARQVAAGAVLPFAHVAVLVVACEGVAFRRVGFSSESGGLLQPHLFIVGTRTGSQRRDSLLQFGGTGSSLGVVTVGVLTSQW